MNKIVPCLWFDDQALEAAKFYCSVFKKSKMGAVTHYDEAASKGAGRPVGSVMTVTFSLNGQEFMGLNGGPIFKFTEAVSLMVFVDTQKELDYYWKELTSGGGQEVQCGWLKDKYGLSWQVVPRSMEKMMKTKDTAARNRYMAEVMRQVKPDIKRLEAAFKGK